MCTYEIWGLALVTAASNCSVVAHSIVKLLDGVPILNVMMGRCMMQLLILGCVVGVLRTRGHSFRFFGAPGQRHLFFIRATAFLGALASGWTAMQKLPLGIATGIVYSNPVICGLFAHFFLRAETLTRAFAIQAVVCVLGTALIIPTTLKDAHLHLSPTGSADLVIGLGAAILSAVLHAVGPCAVRVMEDVHPLEIQLFQDVFAIAVTIPLCAAMGTPITNVEVWNDGKLAYLLCFTMVGLSGSLLFICGWRLAPVTKATLFTYTEIPTSFIVQVHFFHQSPTPRQILGASLIVFATCMRFLVEASNPADKKSLQRSVSQDEIMTQALAEESVELSALQVPGVKDSRKQVMEASP
mmetsp:Transcript_7899/g.14348  ORF Transcript_7899/g.14348 Transcript_7899/m.14348 type:complete len:355 (-) Transcript_7899:131-1195(-)